MKSTTITSATSPSSVENDANTPSPTLDPQDPAGIHRSPDAGVQANRDSNVLSPHF